MDLDTTIVALSSSSGRASRSLIRASGTSAFDGARKLGLHPQPRQLCKGTLIVEGGSLPVLVCAFPQGSSYTGQDTIEIQLPNNQFLVNTVIGLLVDATDGRLAEAGEFTARAFFLGRLSLTEAEGVSATISANNEAELLGASLLRHGALASIVDPLAKDVASTLARVEAGIDFTDEEDVVVITDKQLKVTIEGCIDIIHSTLEGRIPMAALRHLPHVVIAGIPNAGKSTLFNALLGSRRVVVSSLAGTTRDAIAEPVKFGNKEAMLIDVAGLEYTTDQLSAFAQESAQNTIETADLIVWCIAPNHSVPPPLSNTIVIHTMGDLEGADTSALCARTGRGLDELRKQIEQKLSSIPQPHRDALAILPRHEQNLIRALHCLTEALHNRATPELTATSLRLALDALGTITGQITPDEVLGQVFSTFCIGK